MNTVSKRLSILIMILVAGLSGLDASPRSKAFLKSLIIPGWGELSQGNPSGWVFLAAEAGLWSSRYYCLQESDLNDRNSYQYAMHYAHIAPGSYDDEYFFALSKFNSSGFESGGYNERVMRDALSAGLSGDDLQSYLDANAIPDDMAWTWDDHFKRSRYTEMRRDITHYEDYAKSVTGFIVLNHLLSGLNALRTARQREKLDLRVGWQDGPMLRGSYRF